MFPHPRLYPSLPRKRESRAVDGLEAWGIMSLSPFLYRGEYLEDRRWWTCSAALAVGGRGIGWRAGAGVAVDIQRLGHCGRGRSPGRLRDRGCGRRLPVGARRRQGWTLYGDYGAGFRIPWQDGGLLHWLYAGRGDRYLPSRRLRRNAEEGLRPHVPGSA